MPRGHDWDDDERLLRWSTWIGIVGLVGLCASILVVCIIGALTVLRWIIP